MLDTNSGRMSCAACTDLIGTWKGFKVTTQHTRAARSSERSLWKSPPRPHTHFKLAVMAITTGHIVVFVVCFVLIGAILYLIVRAPQRRARKMQAELQTELNPSHVEGHRQDVAIQYVSRECLPCELVWLRRVAVLSRTKVDSIINLIHMTDAIL